MSNWEDRRGEVHCLHLLLPHLDPRPHYLDCVSLDHDVDVAALRQATGIETNAAIPMLRLEKRKLSPAATVCPVPLMVRDEVGPYPRIRHEVPRITYPIGSSPITIGVVDTRHLTLHKRDVSLQSPPSNKVFQFRSRSVSRDFFTVPDSNRES